MLKFSCTRGWRAADCSEELTSRAARDLCSGCSEGAAVESGGHGRWLLCSFKLNSVSSLHIAIVFFTLLTLEDELPHHLPVQKQPFALSGVGKYLPALQTSRCISMKEANGRVASQPGVRRQGAQGLGCFSFVAVVATVAERERGLNSLRLQVAVEILL